jgi:hypothetical protein
VQVGDLLNRHKWGVGERVLCEWKPSGIDINLVAKMGSFEVGDFWNGPTFRYFISPFCAANKLIIFRLGSIEYIPKTEVIAPESLKAENAKELFFGLGYGVPGGAGFNVDVSVLPDSVSFREVTIMEEPSADSAITGYFEDLVFSNVWHHSEERGAGQWYSVTGDNFVFKDEVKMGDALILPVSSGNITWRIPVKWTGGMVTNYLPVSYEQSFDMSDIGCLRVSKFGFWVERDLYNERNVSEGVMRCEELQ